MSQTGPVVYPLFLLILHTFSSPVPRPDLCLCLDVVNAYVLTLPSPMSWKARHPGLGWDDGYGDGEGVSLPSDFNRHAASIRCQRLESIFLAKQSGIKLGAEDDSSVGE